MKIFYSIIILLNLTFMYSQDKALYMQRVENLYEIEPYNVGKIVSINTLGDIFALSSYNLYFLKNGSNTWVEIDEAIYWSTFNGSSVTGIYCSSDNSIYVETTAGLYFSNNTSTYDLTHILFDTKVFSTVVNSYGTIFSGTTDGLYKSTNSGTSWSLTYEYPLKMSITPDDIMYIEEYNKGLCRSNDLGATWEVINFNLSKDIEINDIEIAMNGTVFISVKDDGLYKLAGNIWVAQGANGDNVNSLHAGIDGYMYCSYLDKIYRKAVSDTNWTEVKSTMGRITTFSSNSTKLIAGYTDDMLIFETINSGSTWTTNGQKIYPTVLSLLTVNNYVFVGTDNGIYRSSDYGVTWDPKQLNLSIYDIELENIKISIGTNDGIYSTLDYLTWNKRTAYPSYKCTKILFKNDITYAAGASDLYKSLDSGAHWQLIPSNFNYPSDIAKLDNGKIFVSDYWPGIWYTSDELSWTNCNLDDRAECVETNLNGDVFASVDGKVYVQRAGQTTWSVSLYQDIYDLVASADQTILGCGYSFFVYSNDNGYVWNHVSSGLPLSTNVNAISKDGNGYIYVGMDLEKGLYKSNIPLPTK